MRYHFRTRHIEDTIRIEEEGLLPQCNRCGYFTRNGLSAEHHATQECKNFAISRDKYYRALRQQDALEVNFTVGGGEIERVSQFRYSGRILDDSDDYTHAVQRQLARARSKWSRMSAILRSQGVKSRVAGYFYKAII